MDVGKPDSVRSSSSQTPRPVDPSRSEIINAGIIGDLGRKTLQTNQKVEEFLNTNPTLSGRAIKANNSSRSILDAARDAHLISPKTKPHSHSHH